MPAQSRSFSKSNLKAFADELNQQVNSEEQLIELLSAVTFSLISEPGDRMLGALERMLGRQTLLQLLVDGLGTGLVLERLGKERANELEDSFGMVPAVLSDSRQRWLTRLRLNKLSEVIQTISSLGLVTLLPEDKNWPKGLFDLGDAKPRVLYVEGMPDVLSMLSDSKSIVGSRDASSYGMAVTRQLIQEISPNVHGTVSGGAVGIDRQVHEVSLIENLATVAVMAGGLDRKYPKLNFDLFSEITKQGALISELPPGAAPTRWRFLQRNRLIASLSAETIVVEAGIRSGSISTANHALELDRPLYAVPGSVLSPKSAGTNLLISEGKAKPWLLKASNPVQHTFRQSALAVRAADAIRQLQIGDPNEIQSVAGLTEVELNLALKELEDQNFLQVIPNNFGTFRYALNYDGRT